MKRPMFDESGNFIEDGIPLCLGGKVEGGTPRFSVVRREDALALCNDPTSPITQMVKDKVMHRQILNGNTNDRSLKRDAEYLQTTHQRARKAALKKERFKSVEKAREKYKYRYKTDPI